MASTPIDSGWAIMIVAGEGASAHKGPTALAEAETRARVAEVGLPAMLDLEAQGPVAHASGRRERTLSLRADRARAT